MCYFHVLLPCATFREVAHGSSAWDVEVAHADVSMHVLLFHHVLLSESSAWRDMVPSGNSRLCAFATLETGRLRAGRQIAPRRTGAGSEAMFVPSRTGGVLTRACVRSTRTSSLITSAEVLHMQ